MGSVPKTLREFESQFEKNLSSNVDSSDYSRSPHLKVQLVESNTEEIPPVDGFGQWSPFDDTPFWHCCSNGSDYIVVNRFSSRVWAVYSMMRDASFSKVVDPWIKNTHNLDRCWIPSSRIKAIGKGNRWVERGIGLKYHDLLADEDQQAKVSMKAWYGQNDKIAGAIADLQSSFAVSSYRFKDDATSSVSEWYSNGKITFNSSTDSENVLMAVRQVMEYYNNELNTATKLRDDERGSFEFTFDQDIKLDRYTELVGKGKGDLQLWMAEVESMPDFKRYRGIDMHTWDRVFLDVGPKYAYMTIPGKGCVNAAPRFVSIQGETIMGRTKVFYNGDGIFV